MIRPSMHPLSHISTHIHPRPFPFDPSTTLTLSARRLEEVGSETEESGETSWGEGLAGTGSWDRRGWGGSSGTGWVGWRGSSWDGWGSGSWGGAGWDSWGSGVTGWVRGNWGAASWDGWGSGRGSASWGRWGGSWGRWGSSRGRGAVDWLADGARAVGDGQGGGRADGVGVAAVGDGGGGRAVGGVGGDDLGGVDWRLGGAGVGRGAGGNRRGVGRNGVRLSRVRLDWVAGSSTGHEGSDSDGVLHFDCWGFFGWVGEVGY